MASPLLRIALRSVRKNWRHSVGATLAVAVGFAAIALFDGYLSDMVRTVSEMMEEQFMMGTLVVEPKGASAAMASGVVTPMALREPEQAVIDEYLRAHADEVVVRMRSLFLSGIASNGRASTPFLAWGYDPAEGAEIRRRFRWDAWYGRPLHEAGPDSVMLARGLGGLLDCVPGTKEPAIGPDGRLVPKERPFACARPRVQLMGSTESGQVNAIEPTVVALGDSGRREADTQIVWLPLELAQRFRNTRSVAQYNVLLRDPSTSDRFARGLAAAAREKGMEIDVIPWKDCYLGRPIQQALGILRTFRSLMAVVVVALVGMAIFSTMVKAVNERTREIGTLRSLGFVRGQVTRLFALEAALLSGGACALGLLLTLAVSALVNGAKLSYDTGVGSNRLPLGVVVDPGSYLGIAAFLVGVAVLAAWFPARRAARAKIPDALAYA